MDASTMILSCSSVVLRGRRPCGGVLDASVVAEGTHDAVDGAQVHVQFARYGTLGLALHEELRRAHSGGDGDAGRHRRVRRRRRSEALLENPRGELTV